MKYDFSKLTEYLNKLHNEKELPSGDVIVYFKGEEVFRYQVGTAKDDTLYCLYSCTKPVTAVAGMQLIERGIINLDDPVYQYLPSYQNIMYRDGDSLLPVGDKLKIRHLFTMSGGLDYSCETDAIQKIKTENPNAATLDFLPAFVSTPLSFEPGKKFQYSLCHDVLAGVIEVASGMRFGEYLQKNIFDPLEMAESTFHLPKEKENRLAPQFTAKDGTIRPIPTGIGFFAMSPNYESGGAGLISTTADYGKFAAALSCGGISKNGARILKDETVDLLRTPQMTDKEEFGCAAGFGYAYGYGVRTLFTNKFGAKSHIGEFGWDGAAGAYILMDPDKKVGIAYTQQVIGWPGYFGCMHAPLRDYTYEALDV